MMIEHFDVVDDEGASAIELVFLPLGPPGVEVPDLRSAGSGVLFRILLRRGEIDELVFAIQ